MSELYQSLSHSKWDCKYHVVFCAQTAAESDFRPDSASSEGWHVQWETVPPG
jgi:hypothetical protein